MSDENTSIGPPPRRPAPRDAAPPKVRTGMTLPPGDGSIAPIPVDVSKLMPAVVVPPPMPRTGYRKGKTVRVAESDLPTRVELLEDDSFDGDVADTTSVDGSGMQPTDRGTPLPPRIGTGDAPNFGGEVVTHGGELHPAPLFLIPALVVGLGGSGLVWALAPTAPAPTVAEAEPEAIEPALGWLADVNEADPARVLPWAERHAVLDRLADVPEGAFVDRRLNLALDLLQAIDSASPCPTFADALARIEAQPDPYFSVALKTARVPTGSDPACADLAGRLAALREPPAPAEPMEPEPAADADAPTDASPGPTLAEPFGPGASERMTSPFRSRAKKKTTQTTKPTEPEPTSSDKVDDELRPFG